MRPKRAVVGDILVVVGGWDNPDAIGTVVVVTKLSRAGWVFVKNLGEGMRINRAEAIPYSAFCTLDEALQIGIGLQYFPSFIQKEVADQYFDRVKALCVKLTEQETRQLIDFLYKKIN